LTGSLFEAATKIDPTAKNVDMLAPVLSAYTSDITFLAYPPVPPHVAPTFMSSITLSASDLLVPAYFGRSDRFVPPVIHVLHADSLRPCKIINNGGSNLLEEGCLTPVGRAIRDAGLIYLFGELSFLNPGSQRSDNMPLFLSIQDCFGNKNTAELASIFINAVPSTMVPNQMVGSLTLSAFTSISKFPLFIHEEDHDPASWKQLAHDHVTGFAAPQGAGAGTNACSPHIQ
jgi:hypothetical protein